MVVLALIVGYVLNFKTWGKHLYAIGGNEPAARMTGVNVDRIKFQAYLFSAFCASVASLLILGYSGLGDQRARRSPTSSGSSPRP